MVAQALPLLLVITRDLLLLQLLRSGDESDRDICIDVTKQYFVTDGSSPADELQCEIAVQIVNFMRAIQGLCPQISTDVSLKIASYAISYPSSMCHCSKVTRNIVWLEPEYSKKSALVICASCGKPDYTNLKPRIPHPSGNSMIAGTVSISNRLTTWMPSRHFIDEAGGALAIRRRISGHHLFRTAVCNEWILSGTASYKVIFQRLTRPYSCGIGMVTPETDLNFDLSWRSDTREWKNAWGFCIDEREENVMDRYRETRAMEESIVVGDINKTNVTNCSALTSLKEFDEFQVTIDATNRTLLVEGPMKEDSRAIFKVKLESEFFLTPNTNGESLSASSHLSQSESYRLPLALAIALKYTGDQALILPFTTE